MDYDAITEENMKKEQAEREIVACLEEYRQDYKDYSEPYRRYAQRVHNLIQGKIDWGNKKPHNAKIHLNKLGIALDAWKAMIKRGLMNFDEWMKVVNETHMESEYMSGFEALRMQSLLLRDEDPKIKVSDALGLGFVENLSILKVVTSVKERKGPGGKVYKTPRTELVPLDIWDYGVDKDCVDLERDEPLYQFHKIVLPKYELLKHASEEGTPSKPYIKSRIEKLNGSRDEDADQQDLAKGKEHVLPKITRKKMITLYEFYGTVLDSDGNIMEYEGTPLENVRVTMSEGCLIDKPVPLCDVPSSFVTHRILRHNKDILGRARGHAGFEINHILSEYVSAMADAGIKSASNMILFKPDALVDPEQGADGFTYDSTIQVMPDQDLQNVISTVRLGELPSTMFSIYNILETNFPEGLATTQMAISGSMPGKQVKATEVAHSQNSAGNLEESVLMDIDDVMIEKLALTIHKQGLMVAKHFSDLDLEYIFSGNKNKIEKFKELRKNKVKLYEELGHTFRFKGHGLRGLGNQSKTGQLVMNLLTSALGSPQMMDILERNDYDVSKMFGIGIKGMGVDPETLKDPKVGEMARERQNYREMGRGISDQEGNGASQPRQPGAAQGSQQVQQAVSAGNNGEY